MNRIALRFPRWSRIIFSATFLISLITGLLWFGLDRWGETEGEFKAVRRPQNHSRRRNDHYQNHSPWPSKFFWHCF